MITSFGSKHSYRSLATSRSLLLHMLALAIFCLRLGCGLAGALLILSPAQINPRFYRTHFLIMLGLTGVAAIFARGLANPGLAVLMGGALLITFIGSMVWSIEGAPAGRLAIVMAFLLLLGSMILLEWRITSKRQAANAERSTSQASQESGNSDDSTTAFAWLIAGDCTSAALLGAATTAMLMGHSYLIAPAMSMTPLLRLLALLLLAILVRMLVAGMALWSWNSSYSLTSAGDVTLLWLPLRWVLGFIGPLILGWMAWQTARIRSTQSATGILYVVVIFCFLGELTSQLLLGTTGYSL